MDTLSKLELVKSGKRWIQLYMFFFFVPCTNSTEKNSLAWRRERISVFFLSSQPCTSSRSSSSLLASSCSTPFPPTLLWLTNPLITRLIQRVGALLLLHTYWRRTENLQELRRSSPSLLYDRNTLETQHNLNHKFSETATCRYEETSLRPYDIQYLIL